MRGQGERHMFFPPKPGAFTQVEDEFIVHAINRLASAMPHRSETEIAQRMALMVSCRAVHRAVQR